MKDELSQNAKDLLELATSGDELSPGNDERLRIRKRIGAAVAAGGAIGLGASAAKASAAAGSASAGAGVAGIAMGGLGLKALAALAVVGGVIGVGALSIPPAPEPAHNARPALASQENEVAEAPELPASPAEAAAQEEAVAQEDTPAAELIPELTPSVTPSAAPEPRVSAPTRQRVAPAPATDEAAVEPAAEAAPPEVGLGDELAFLRAAQRARVAGDAAEALRQLAAHEARFPDGRLAAERDGTRVFVLCDADRADEASAARQAFLRDHPRSPLARRVEIECR